MLPSRQSRPGPKRNKLSLILELTRIQRLKWRPCAAPVPASHWVSGFSMNMSQAIASRVHNRSTSGALKFLSILRLVLCGWFRSSEPILPNFIMAFVTFHITLIASLVCFRSCLPKPKVGTYVLSPAIHVAA